MAEHMIDMDVLAQCLADAVIAQVAGHYSGRSGGGWRVYLGLTKRLRRAGYPFRMQGAIDNIDFASTTDLKKLDGVGPKTAAKFAKLVRQHAATVAR